MKQFILNVLSIIIIAIVLSMIFVTGYGIGMLLLPFAIKYCKILILVFIVLIAIGIFLKSKGV